MDMSNFYSLSSKWVTTTVEVHTDEKFGPWNAPIRKDQELITGNYEHFNLPLIYIHTKGKHWRDILDTGMPNIFLISKKMVNIMTENKFTGWKLFDIEIYDKENNLVPGYYGLSAIGRCGPQDYTKCKTIFKQYIENGPIVERYKEFHFDIDTWDGSDFFFPENYLGFTVTERVKIAFEKAKLTNVKFRSLLDWEMNKKDVLQFMKKLEEEKNVIS
jgi:hypothetical protein